MYIILIHCLTQQTNDNYSNKYECTTDQELMGLLHIRGQTFHFHSPGGSTALCCVKGRHGRHLESLTSYPTEIQLVNRCVFTLGTILPDFILIQFETTEHALGFFEEVAATRRSTRKNE